MARLHPLIARWTGNIPVAELEIIRAAEYTFRAQIADRWRDRRVFLLGDAAHLTPPFIGQGMCAGLRDAMNLAWKLAGVLGGPSPETVLDTYEIERRHHARAMIRLAKLIGTAMTAGGEVGNASVAPWRHGCASCPASRASPRTARQPPLHRSDLVARPRLRRSLAGGLCPNAVVDGDRRFDDVAAGRFAIVTSIEPSAALRADIERRGAVLDHRPTGQRTAPMVGQRDRRSQAIMHPDGAVLRAGRNLAALCAALPQFTPNHRHGIADVAQASAHPVSGERVPAAAAEELPRRGRIRIGGTP